MDLFLTCGRGTGGLPVSDSLGIVEPARSILVTGGAGYVGSHACKALAAAGYTPVVFDNFENGHDWAVRWGPGVVGDLADTVLLARTIAEHDVVAVLHFAAHAYVGESMVDPGKYYRNNVAGTISLLDAMKSAGVEKLVFSSSCATYGVPEAVPISECTPQRPVNPYGESKLCVERMLDWHGRAGTLRWIALRYFNAAGADPAGDIGEVHDPETHLLPLVIQAALGKRDAIRVFGTDYPTPDGTCVRDYIHVSDLARAHTAALDYLLRGGESAAFNLGTGRGYSVREVIEAVRRVSRRPVPVEEAPRREGDPPVLVADASKARSVLGWHPQFDTLDAIVKTAYNWHS